MQIKKNLKQIIDSKLLFLCLSVTTSCLVLIGTAILIKIHIPTFQVDTTLEARDLLVLAGLTITFYTLLDKTIEKLLGRFIDNEMTKAGLDGVIFSNIIMATLSILLILGSTMGIPYLKKEGFILLIISWMYNLVILCFVILYMTREVMAPRKIRRYIINLILLIISLSILIPILWAII